MVLALVVGRGLGNARLIIYPMVNVRISGGRGRVLTFTARTPFGPVVPNERSDLGVGMVNQEDLHKRLREVAEDHGGSVVRRSATA